MRRQLKIFLIQSSFWLSVLFHLFMLLSFSLIISYQPFLKEKEPQPEIFVPAYIPTKPSAFNTANQVESEYEKIESTTKDGILSEKYASLNEYVANQYRSIHAQDKLNPVHVVGDKLMDDPLRELLGIVLTSHIIYPKVAMQLQMRGVVSIELLLFPDGSIKNIKLIKSSGENILDNAALNAIKAMSPVRDVNMYIKEPKLLVFYVIF